MRRLPGLVLLCVLLSGCGGPSSGIPVPIERIVGTERLAWNQNAITAEVLASIRFVTYVDGLRSEMQDVVCGSTVGADGFPCSGRLPQMSPGRHTLQLASVGGAGASNESAPSVPLGIIVVSTSTASLSVGPSTSFGTGALAQQELSAVRAFTTADRVRLSVQALLTGLADPTDLALLPDGRMLVAERGGSIRVVPVDQSTGEASSVALALGDVDTRREGGLLALALDPQFDKNRYVYVVYTTVRGFRLARFREGGNLLVDRVILLDGVPASRVPPAAVLRFGPDDKLYLGLDDGGDSRRAGDLGSYNGKLLRFNSDATTPRDQAGGTPVFALDVNAPLGIEWAGNAGFMSIWIAQHSLPGELRAFVVPSRDRAGLQRARVAARYLLPEGTQASQIAMYRGTLIPEFRGDLLMAAGDHGGLLRVRFDPSNPLKVIATERLIDDGEGRVRAIAVGSGGVIYFSTSTTLRKITRTPAETVP